MKPLLRFLGWLAVSLSLAAAEAPRVFMVGDSTMANKLLDLPERGWGMALGALLSDSAMVRNHAMTVAAPRASSTKAAGLRSSQSWRRAIS